MQINQSKTSTILKLRDSLLDKDFDDPELDKISEDVLKLLYKGRNEFPIDFILESITRMGYAPSLIYDDDGRWAVDDEGVQTVCIDPVQATYRIKKSKFHKTIRSAVIAYLSKLKKEGY